MRFIRNGALAVLLALGTTACLDLDVVNQNNPDIERALRDPADVEQVIASSFILWYGYFVNSTDASRPYPQLADELTTTVTTRQHMWSIEPREPLDNNPQGEQVWIPRRPWDVFSECAANTNDGLKPIEGKNPDYSPREPMEIMTTDATGALVDNTDRAVVFAKLMQGICHGYLALTNDQVATANEDTIIPVGFENQRQWEREHLKPWNQTLEMAIKSLEDAIARAESSPGFTTPLLGWVHQQSYSSTQLAQLAHTMIARLLVLAPRTPEERAAVNWQKVLFHTERGMAANFDFGPTLESSVVRSNNWLGLLTGSASTSNEFRVDNLYLGPADQSGRFQAWLEAPDNEKRPFMIITPDRRVSGAPTAACTQAARDSMPIGGTTACSPNGAYFTNRNTLSNFTESRGVKYQSYYRWGKRSNTGYGGFNHTTGQHIVASGDENRLLRAEALLRTGQVQAAIDLINVTRTRGVRIGSTNIPTNLPAIPPTADAATRLPLVNNTCVPRKRDGSCGDVWDALYWEVRMELMGYDPVRYWAWARGIPGYLQPGTLLHWPIPGRYAVSLELPVYTHGGVGGTGAAR